MSETLSFPGLGLELNLSRVAFTVAGHPIYWYGIIIALAFLLGSIYVLRRVKTFGLDGDRMMDTIIAGVLLGVICARLYYVVFSGDSTYFESLLNLINIRKGGIAIYGGVIGAVIAGVIMSRVRNFKLLPTFDAVTGGLLLGQAVGRWGNFVNIEAFGSNTSMPWGMTSPSIERYLTWQQAHLASIGTTVDPAMPVHPTFFYESMWCLLGFAVIAWYTRRRKFDGELSLIYIGWYGLGRAFIEGLRTDPLLIGAIRVSQLVAIVCVVAAAVLLAAVHSRIRREGDPEYLKLHVDTEEGKAIVAGAFYKKKDAQTEQTGAGQLPEDKEARPEGAAQEQSEPPPAAGAPEKTDEKAD